MAKEIQICNHLLAIGCKDLPMMKNLNIKDMNAINNLFARLKRRISIISSKIRSLNKKSNLKSKNNVQPPSWGSPM